MDFFSGLQGPTGLWNSAGQLPAAFQYTSCVMMSHMFMMIPSVYDDQRMTSWKELCWFYVRMQGGSVYLQYLSCFIIINVNYHGQAGKIKLFLLKALIINIIVNRKKLTMF